MMTFMKKKCLLEVTITIIFLLALSPHAAADLDISGPIICAFTKGFDCDNSGGCQETSPDNVGLPPFVKLDLANSKLTATAGQKPGEIKESTIKSFQEIDGKLFLQGIDRRGWSAVIDKQTGHMAVSASSEDEAIVFFGRCTTP
jgi:hypothetical protein